MIERDDIPLGCTLDSSGNVLTYKHSNGSWEEYTRDALGNELTHKNSDGFWREYTRDASGSILTFKSSTGYSSVFTRDASGNELTYNNSDGFWYEYTYDASGNELTYKDSYDNVLLTSIANDGEYALSVSEDRTLIAAGCQRFEGFDAVSEALSHWDRTDDRAVLFTEALRKL